MEFNFEVHAIFPGQITVIASESNNSPTLKIYDVESDKNSKCRKNWTYAMMANNAPMYKKIQKMKQQLENVIDEMGVASAKAQGLHTSITSVDKLLHSNQQRLYVMKDTECPKAVISILKVGIKGLFLNDEKGNHYEVSPLCILDFYVHETKQRQGYGHILFDSMLKAENVAPDKLAIDRPSTKLLLFLAKHYDLKGAITHSNNFVVFPSFFQNLSDHLKNKKGTLKHLQHSQFHSNENDDSKQFNLAQSSDSFTRNRYVTPSTEMLLQWNVASKSSLDNLQQDHSAVDSYKQNYDTATEMNKKSAMNWGVRDAMHSYHARSNNAEKSKRGDAFQSPTTSSLNTVLKNCHKWNQLQTSWNVLGVKPQDYSKFQTKNITSIIAGRPS